MPWIIDRTTGEKRYQVSLYTKEELPTWGEVYNDWLNEHRISYIRTFEDHQELDHYWKIPRRKYLQAVVCNQFNKMLFEDGKRELALKFYNEEFINHDSIMEGIEAVDIRFIIEDINNEMRDQFTGIYNPKEMIENTNKYLDKIIRKYNISEDGGVAPPIYTIPLPTGKKNPFIVNDHKRIDVNTLDDYMLAVMPIVLLKAKLLDKDGYIIHQINPYSKYPWSTDEMMEDSYDEFTYIIRYMLKEMCDYFKDPIGWKDEDGNSIPKMPYATTCEAGSDPAL